MLNLTSDIPLYALGGIRQERGWDPRSPTLKTDGSKRPEPLEVDLGPTDMVKEWTRSLRRVLATVSLRSLIHDDLPAGELRGRPKKLAEILHHPLCGLPVALFSALLVLKDAHRNYILLPLAGNQDEVGDKPPHVPDKGHKVFLNPPNHLADGGRVRLVVAYSR